MQIILVGTERAIPNTLASINRAPTAGPSPLHQLSLSLCLFLLGFKLFLPFVPKLLSLIVHFLITNN